MVIKRISWVSYYNIKCLKGISSEFELMGYDYVQGSSDWSDSQRTEVLLSFKSEEYYSMFLLKYSSYL